MKLNESGQRVRIRLSDQNINRMNDLIQFFQQAFPNDVRNNTDAVNVALEFVFEFIVNPALENNKTLAETITQYKQSAKMLGETNIQRSLSHLNENVEKLLLLELNSLSVDYSLPPEVRANMIGPLREGSAGYIANQRLREISEAVKKRQINANKSGTMK